MATGRAGSCFAESRDGQNAILQSLRTLNIELDLMELHRIDIGFNGSIDWTVQGLVW